MSATAAGRTASAVRSQRRREGGRRRRGPRRGRSLLSRTRYAGLRRGGPSAELLRMTEPAELRDVAAEEERHGPVDDDPRLSLGKGELVQVVRARHPPAEEAVQAQAEHLRDALVAAGR